MIKNKILINMIPTQSTLARDKVILLLCDGMRADTAFEQFGYLNNVNELLYRGISIVDNPSVSRTNYETLHTGVPASVHGITSNLVNRKSSQPHLFKLLTKQNRTSGIVGSSWFYDLYGKESYDYVKHKEINKDDNEDITYGRFYSDDISDSYNPDVEGLAHTFQTADHIITKYIPDYVLIHLVTPDKIGHEEGVGKKYKNEISKIDSIMGAILPKWLAMGYDVIITSDHGMDEDHSHGSVKREVMEAPLYIISQKPWILPEINDHTQIMKLVLNRII